MTVRARTALIPVVVTALLAAACGSGDDAADDEGPDIDPAEVLGAEDVATGEPLQIGFVYDGTTDAIDNAAELAAAEAAAEYVNTHLGGVGGRPIELDVCSTDQSPSGASDCVSQMVSDEVPIVLNGVTGQAPSLFPQLAEAGVRVFTPGAGDQATMFADGVQIMTNGIVALLTGPGKLAADAGVERAAIVVIDVPAASGIIEETAPLFYEPLGVEVDIVTVPPDTPDVTPSIAAELDNDPGQITVIGDPAFCLRALDGIANSGYDGRVAIIPHCIDESLTESASNLEGVFLTTMNTTDPDSEEYQLYDAVLEQFGGEDAERGGVAPSGYQAVVGFARAMEGLTGEVTPESIDAAFAAMPPTPMPLADGITYQCNRQQVEVAPNFCSTDVLWTELDAEGNGVDFQVLPGADLTEMG